MRAKGNHWRQFYTFGIAERHTPLGVVRVLSVEKLSGRDGISWDRLQEIKNEIFGVDSVCVEVYPAAEDLVYEVNRRHLWELPSGTPFFNLRRG